MPIATTETLLPIDVWASLLGVVPAHFAQGTSQTVFPLTGQCSGVYWQFPWQAFDAVSREDIAMEISIAEEDIAEQLGYWPAPKWIAQDVKQYPRYHRPDVFFGGGLNVRGAFKSVVARYGKIISAGRRAVDPVRVPTVGLEVEFTNEDTDGFDETVTVEVATTLTDECEVKVYFAGHGGDPEWEIRPARTKAIAAGLFTATFWAWQFIDPDLWFAIPTPDTAGVAIDLDTAVYVDTVDVYREYNDTTAVTAVFYWEPDPSSILFCTACGGAGCTACQLTTQDGCIHIRDPERGILVPTPATYDTEWETTAWTECRDPDITKIYYYCGDLSNKNLAGYTCEPLSNYWAQAIAAMATARLERPFCNCGNSAALAEHWRTDVASQGPNAKAMSFSLLDNPFGTRMGEILAWQRVNRHKKRGGAGAAAI